MKKFKVKIYFGARRTEVEVQAINAVSAITIAKKMYKDSRVISAQQIK